MHHQWNTLLSLGSSITPSCPLPADSSEVFPVQQPSAGVHVPGMRCGLHDAAGRAAHQLLRRRVPLRQLPRRPALLPGLRRRGRRRRRRRRGRAAAALEGLQALAGLSLIARVALLGVRSGLS